MSYESSDSFPVELETGEVVRIVDKQPDPQLGTVLVTDDGRLVKDDYNTLAAAYEAPVADVVVEQPVEVPVEEQPVDPDAAA